MRTICKVPDCEKIVNSNGYCKRHSWQIAKHGGVFDLIKRGCQVKGCTEKHGSKGYCAKHYAQFKRNGEILKTTIFDPNKIKTNGIVTKIILRDIHNKCTEEAVIDTDDLSKVQGFKWCLSGHGYVITRRGDKSLFLHNVILDRKPDSTKQIAVDHVNRNKLDNRKINLRLCTCAENSRNGSIRSDNTSGVRGVSWNKQRQLWDTYIKINSRFIRLGMFNNLVEAAHVRREAELKYFKEFAPIRIPTTQMQQSL